MNMEQLLVEKLQALYGAEQQFVEALRQNAEQVSNPELKSAFEQHRRETEQQAQRLQQVLQRMNQQAQPQVKETVRAMIQESQQMAQRVPQGPQRDVVLAASAQIMEHYEISAYGTARTICEALGQNDAAQVLQQTLDEEKKTDKLLTEVSERILSSAMQTA